MASYISRCATEFAIGQRPKRPEFIINQRSIVAAFAKYDWTERPVFATDFRGWR